MLNRLDNRRRFRKHLTSSQMQPVTSGQGVDDGSSDPPAGPPQSRSDTICTSLPLAGASNCGRGAVDRRSGEGVGAALGRRTDLDHVLGSASRGHRRRRLGRTLRRVRGSGAWVVREGALDSRSPSSRSRGGCRRVPVVGVASRSGSCRAACRSNAAASNRSTIAAPAWTTGEGLRTAARSTRGSAATAAMAVKVGR